MMCVHRTANCSDVPITQKGLIELKVTLPRNTYSEQGFRVTVEMWCHVFDTQQEFLKVSRRPLISLIDV